MFNELNYIYKLAEEIHSLQQSAKKLNKMVENRLISPAIKIDSFSENIEQVINESIKIQQICIIICQQVQQKGFIPHTIQQYKIESLVMSTISKPVWFNYVLQQQFLLKKQQFDAYALRLLHMHQLQVRAKALSLERVHLQHLYKRYLSLHIFQRTTEAHSDINLLQEVNHLKHQIDHTKKSYANFCNQVANQISQYVKQMINKSKIIMQSQFKPVYNSNIQEPEVYYYNLPIVNNKNYYYSTQCLNHVENIKLKHQHTCQKQRKSQQHKFFKIKSAQRIGCTHKRHIQPEVNNKFNYRRYAIPTNNEQYYL